MYEKRDISHARSSFSHEVDPKHPFYFIVILISLVSLTCGQKQLRIYRVGILSGLDGLVKTVI